MAKSFPPLALLSSADKLIRLASVQSVKEGVNKSKDSLWSGM